MSQRFSLYRDLTVDQNIRFFAGIYGIAGARFEERRRFVVEMAGLRGREHTRTADLAGGWRQRLALGCAILHEPPIVFLDEPTGGVDPLSRRMFWKLIDAQSAAGHDRPRHDALSRRGGALPPDRHHRRGPSGRARHHRRAQVHLCQAAHRRSPVRPSGGCDEAPRRDGASREDEHLRHCRSCRPHGHRRWRPRGCAPPARRSRDRRRQSSRSSPPRSKTSSSKWRVRGGSRCARLSRSAGRSSIRSSATGAASASCCSFPPSSCCCLATR